MAQTITFSSVFIRTAALALDEGTKRIRINVTASLTKEVRDKMDWQELEKPRGFKGRLIEEAASSVDLEGELHGKTMTLTPNDKEIVRRAFSIEIGQVHDFKLATVQEENSKRRELRFQIITVAKGALGKLEDYADAVGQAKGSLKISYVEQSALDLDTGVMATDEQRQAVLDGE
jgi:hypothetical protein